MTEQTTHEILVPDGDYTPWSLSAAVRWYNDHADPAYLLGWQVSLCGSVIGDTFGRDLDVIAVPIRADAEDLCAIWEEGMRDVLVTQDSPTGVRCRVFCDDEDRLIDVAFFPRRPLPEEATPS